MRRVRRFLAAGFLVASLAVPGSMWCACSDDKDADQHEHCTPAGASLQSLDRGCDCVCMTAPTQPSAIGRTVMTFKSAPLATQFVPLLDIARPPAFQPRHGSAILFPSPPVAPPLVLRV
jgi:hypothetical protein